MIAQKALAYFTSDAVDGLDQGVLSSRCVKDCARNGRFHTAMMVEVLVFGYATGMFSSCKIARKLYET